MACICITVTGSVICQNTKNRIQQGLPMKTNETEIAYAQRIKAAFQSVHIFITSDTEEDVGTIRNVFENWRNSQ